MRSHGEETILALEPECSHLAQEIRGKRNAGYTVRQHRIDPASRAQGRLAELPFVGIDAHPFGQIHHFSISFGGNIARQ